MARPKASPEHRAEVRRSIQQAAVELYRSEGLSGISARAVAKKAGVSVGTIYSYFGDLSGLGQSLWEPQIAQLETELYALAAQHDDPLARIEALLRAYFAFGTEQTELYRNALMFVRPSALEAPEKQALTEFAFPTLLRAAIQEGQTAGEISNTDPQVLVQILWSGLHGALALPVNLDRVALLSSGSVREPLIGALMRAIRA